MWLLRWSIDAKPSSIAGQPLATSTRINEGLCGEHISVMVIL
jgi:hypothetical protein